MSNVALERVDFHTHVQIGSMQQKSALAKVGSSPCDIIFEPSTGLVHVTHKASKRTVVIPMSNVAAMYPVPVQVAPTPTNLAVTSAKK